MQACFTHFPLPFDGFGFLVDSLVCRAKEDVVEGRWITDRSRPFHCFPPLLTTSFIFHYFFLSFHFSRTQVKLERVLGLTVTSNAALACDPNTGTVAYPAGYVWFYSFVFFFKFHAKRKDGKMEGATCSTMIHHFFRWLRLFRRR